MSRIFIVDQSLKGVGGHHYDYALQTSTAAAQQGYEVTLYTNQKFGGCSKLESVARVIPCFKKTTYSKDSLLSGLRSMAHKPSMSECCPLEILPKMELLPPERLLWGAYGPDQKRKTLSTHFDRFRCHAGQWLQENGFLGNRNLWKEQQRRQKAISLFQDDCRQAFEPLDLSSTDHIFFTTINDLEVAGWAKYLAEHTESRFPVWHLQFHFELFSGRPNTHKRQKPFVKPIESLFKQLDKRAPFHQIHLYGTTQAIVDQYQSISCFPVKELTYPIAGCINHFSIKDNQTKLVFPSVLPKQEETQAAEEQANATAQKPNRKPLQISIAGGVRQEKGQCKIQEIVPELYSKIFTPGWARLSLQRKVAKKLFKKRPFQLTLPEGVDPRSIQYLPHPLSSDAYSDFIQQSDIGLITYDPEAYHSRRAGVFCEFLAEGVPVAVPAATWMADQVQQVNEGYRQQILAEFGTEQSWNYRTLEWADWNLPASGGKINFDNHRSPAQAKLNFDDHLVPDQDSCINFQFHWLWHKTPGFFLELQAVFHDSKGKICGSHKSVLGKPHNESVCGTLIPVPAGTRSIFFGLTNACGNETLSIERLRIDLLKTGQVRIPLGSIGCIFKNEQDLVPVLLHMCQHHSHYRRCAMVYRDHWRSHHDPHKTIRQLIKPNRGQALAYAS